MAENDLGYTGEIASGLSAFPSAPAATTLPSLGSSSTASAAAESAGPNSALLSPGSVKKRKNVAASILASLLKKKVCRELERPQESVDDLQERLSSIIDATIMPMRTFPSEVEVQENALCIFFTAAELPLRPHSELFNKLVASRGGIEAVMRAMQHHLTHSRLLLLGFTVLSSILPHATNARVVMRQVADVLIAVPPSCMDVGLQGIAGKVLGIIMSRPWSASDRIDFTLDDLMATLQAMWAYERALDKPQARLQADLKDLRLKMLHRVERADRTWVARNGGIKLLLQASASDPHDGAMQRQVFAFLVDFAYTTAFAKQVVHYGGIATVVNAMRLNMQDAHLQQLGCTILGGLSTTVAMSLKAAILAANRVDWEDCALFVLSTAAHEHFDKVCVSLVAMTAMDNIVLHDRELAKRMIKYTGALSGDPLWWRSV